jgi:hypothetical protein
MSSAEIERRTVEKAYALRDALVAAKRFWTYGRYADDTRRVSAGVIGALHGAGRSFLIMLERKEGARLQVRAAVTTEGYARFAQTYEECVREQAQLDAMQARWENAQLHFAWTEADREDIRV